MSDFYDRMASLYHLIFQDWDASIERQAGQLVSIIEERWGLGCRTVLDVSCGIGTQALGLAMRGFTVTASDLSSGAIARAKVESQRRSLQIDFSVCDYLSFNACTASSLGSACLDVVSKPSGRDRISRKPAETLVYIR